MVPQENLQKAYKSQLLAVHPDKNPGSEAYCNSKTDLVLKAWERLKDPSRRRIYDNEVKFSLKVRTHKHANSTYTYIHIYTTDIVQIGSCDLLTIAIYMHTHIKVLFQKQVSSEVIERNQKLLAEQKKSRGKKIR